MPKVQALSTKFPETRRADRTDRFWPTAKQVETIPAIGANKGVMAEAVLMHLKFTEPGAAYYVAELDPETGSAFGYIDTGDPTVDEWGHFNLVDLEKRKVPSAGAITPGAVQRVTDWRPAFAYVAIEAMAAAAEPEQAAEPERYRLGAWCPAIYSLAKYVTREQLYAAMHALTWWPVAEVSDETRTKITKHTQAWTGFPVGRAAAQPIADGFTLYAAEDADNSRRAYFVGNANATALILTAKRAA